MSHLQNQNLPLSIPQDYHMHSNFSGDSRASMEDMCRGAIKNGVAEIGFTEHYDLHSMDKHRDWFKPEPWWAELEHCRDFFAGQLIIRAGIELGEPHIYHDEAAAMLERYPFDYALGSLHIVGQETIFKRHYFTSRTPNQAYGDFFRELAQMTERGGFDILSHFDLPARFGKIIYGGYDPANYEDMIRPILQNCIDQGIALDINTKALRTTAQVMTPDVEILTWYAEMGGTRVTLGSDAHNPQDIGANLDVALVAMEKAGLQGVTYYRNRQPYSNI